MNDPIFPATSLIATQRLVQKTDSTKLPFTGVAAGLLVSACTIFATPMRHGRVIPIEFDKTKDNIANTAIEAFSGSSTEAIGVKPSASNLVEGIMQLGRGIVFEDGVETVFSSKLIESVRGGGIYFIEALQNFIMSGRADEEASAEAFRWIGALDDAPTHDARWNLLLGALRYSSLKLRDGALMGLAALGEKRSLPYLSTAVTLQENSALRGDIETLIRQLR